MKFPALALYLLVASPFQSHAELRGFRKERKLVADAILSAVHSSDGTVDHDLLLQAHRSGIPAEFLHSLARKTLAKLNEPGVTMDDVEKDVRRLARGDEPEMQKQKTNEIPASSSDTSASASNNAIKTRSLPKVNQGPARALSEAVLSALKSETGTMDQDLFEYAVAAGNNPHVILKAHANLMKHKK